MTKYFKDIFAIYGDAVEIPDNIQSSGSVSYQQGFTVDYQRKLGTDPLAKPFSRQAFNGLMMDITSAIQQYQQFGFFDFITPEKNGGSPFSYSIGACVRYDVSTDGSDIRNFTSLINSNEGNPVDNPADWNEIGVGAKSGYSFSSVVASETLTVDKSGVILVDASSGDLVVTLPSATESTLFIIKRIDNTSNKVKVQTGGTDKIKYNLSINPNGYSFFHLYGAGDYWTLTNDGDGSWYDLDRIDNSPIGTSLFNISSIAPIGGYLVANGTELSRSDYPYLWDFAQKSGALVAESERSGNEGCFTSGDGSTTFRIPDLRGNFLRALDLGAGIDSNRKLGSSQKGTLNVIGAGPTYPDASGTFCVSDGVSAISEISMDAVSANDYPTGRSTNPGANTSVALTTNEASFGATRPRNITYPVYIKII